ncbi:unnamed protein product [Mytilus edulis]|uniref:Uncharacterized protein n=1 Tax=Mytilus edulis TaxID=6550 RepID=A0A8S3Q094_MYTED|nr:unnamed protein product [Mytilus edulis]
MPSTVKLTPGPNRQKTSINRSQTFSSPSPYLRTSLLNTSCSFQERSDGNLSISSTNGHSRSPAPFLPSIKRALGVSEYSPRQENSVVPPSYQNYPSQASPGFVPAVRLIKRERSYLGHQKSPSVRSSNVVRIAPPEPHKLSSPRLFHIQTSSTDSRRTPDTQAVIQALKEKSLKRSYGGYDHDLDTSYTDYPVQQAKRRRQDSQQSNSSTSSLPPLPDSLPDLSSSGYTIPRLETPTLKRSAHIDDWDDSCSAKKLRKDGRVNSILSSLSSSQRVAEKEVQVKRKVSTNGKENNPSISKLAKKDTLEKISLDRSDTVIISTTEGVEDTPSKETDTPIKDTSLDSSVTVDKPKMVTLNQSFSARKRQTSLYSGLNKSFQKVPHANVIASMEDYENDMGAEKKRVQDMLEGIHQAETEKEKEKEASKNSTAFGTSVKASETVPPTIAQVSGFQTSSLVTTAASTVSSAGLSLTSTGSIPSSTSTSSVTTAAGSNPMMFKFATVKSSSPLKTTTQGGLMSGSSPIGGINSSAGGNTTTVTSAGMALSTGFSAASAVSASGAPKSAVPPFGLSTTQGTSAPSGLNFGTTVTPASSTPLQSGFNFGSQPAGLSSVPGFGATSTATPTVTTKAPPSYGFTTNVTTAPLATPTPSGFNFGSATSASGAPGTGQTASVFGTQQGAPGFGAQTQASQPFGSQPPPAYGSSTLSFGAAQPQSTAASFGMQPSTNATTTTNSTGTNPTASTFNFKSFNNQTPAQQPTTQPAMFGSQPNAGVSTFGPGGSTATTTPGFGGTPSSFGQATSTAPSGGGFNFGASTPSFGSQGTSGFGQTSASSAKQFGTAGFGAAPTQPGFSATTASTTFGQGTTNMFGQTTTTASSFGQGTSSFGTTSSVTGFGTAVPFGQSSVPKSTSSASFGPSGATFGQGSTTSGPTFGQGSTTAGPTFGQGSTTAGPTFGQGSTTAGPTFGQGSTTSGPTFGQGGTSFAGPQPVYTGGGNIIWNYYQNNSQWSSWVPSTQDSKVGGGFDFSASTTPSNTGGGGGGYNFSANASFVTPTGMATPVFGTPTGGATPNMFSVGGTGSVPKPRVARRGRRGIRGR